MINSSKRVQVWDRFVRLFHWSLVLAFATAYSSTVGSQRVHEWAGYIALALVTMRIFWGFAGSQHARFADFVPAPRSFMLYVRACFRSRAPRYLGHNPAGAMMILFLLAMVVAIGTSGWMLTLDAFWGDEMVEEIHVALVNITLAAIAIHVAAAIYESLHHRENLVLSMMTGKKRPYSVFDIVPDERHKQ